MIVRNVENMNPTMTTMTKKSKTIIMTIRRETKT